MSSSCNIMFTLYATSFVEGIVALVSHYPRSRKSRVVLNGEILYTCREMISEFEFFMYFMDEIVTLKNL